MRRILIFILSLGIVCLQFSGINVCFAFESENPTEYLSSQTLGEDVFSLEFNSTVNKDKVNYTSGAVPNVDGIELKCYDGSFSTIDPDKGSLKLKLEGDARAALQNGENTYLSITYEDPVSTKGYGWFYITYSGYDGTTLKTDNIYLEGTGNLQTRTVLLNGACFNDSDKAYDIDIRLSPEKEKLSKATYNYSNYPVKIKAVKGTTDNTVAPIKGEIKTLHPGNIFFDNEKIEFTVKAENVTNDTYNCYTEYKIYKFDKEDDYSTIYKSGDISSLSLDAKEKSEFKFTVSDSLEYGLYRIEVYLTNTSKSIRKMMETDFSVCRRSVNQNYNLGVAVHTGRYSSDSDVENIAMPLIKKAGFGVVREGITWSSYETSQGEYKLNDRSTALLDCLYDYNMKYMMTVSAGNKIYPEISDKDMDVDYDSIIVGQQHLDKFGTYVNKLVSEPKVQKVLSMVEIINEPELRPFLYNGEYASANDLYDSKDVNNTAIKAGAEVYAKIIEAAVDAVERANVSNDTDFKTSAFCTSGGFGGVMSFHDKYIDCVLSVLDENNHGERVFDSISAHPYCWFSDPELGHYGDVSTDPSHSVAYRLDYFKGLVSGHPVYDPVQDKDVFVSGRATGNEYAFDIDDEMWFSETGFSSAHEPEPGREVACVGSEYEQARRIIAQSNVLRAYNNDNKICYYNFKNKGNSRNMMEPNFGFVKHDNYKVPYAAKYSYLAMAAMNSLVADREYVELYNLEDFKFITEYSSNKDTDKVLSVWTTKDSENTLTKSEIKDKTGININKETVTYYDMLGNQLSESDVLSGSDYKLTKEPYYIVCGELEKSEDKNLLLCIDKNSGEVVDVTTLSVNEFAQGFNEDKYNIDSYIDYKYRNADYSLFFVSYKDGNLADVEILKTDYDGVVKKRFHSTGASVNSSFSDTDVYGRPEGWRSINPNDETDTEAMLYEFENPLMQGRYKLEFEIKPNGSFDMGLLGSGDFPEENYTIARLSVANVWKKWMTDNENISGSAGLTKKHRLQKKLIGGSGGILYGYNHTKFPDLENSVGVTEIAKLSDDWKKVEVILDFDTREYTASYNNKVIEGSFEHLNRQYVAIGNSCIGSEIPENPTEMIIQNTATSKGNEIDKKYDIKYKNGIKGIWLGEGAEYRNVKLKDVSNTRYNLNQSFDNLNVDNLTTAEIYTSNSAILVHPWHQAKIDLSTDNDILEVNVNTSRTAEFAIPFKNPIMAGRQFTVEFDYKPVADNNTAYSFIMNLEGEDYLTYYTHPDIRENSVWGLGTNMIYRTQKEVGFNTSYKDEGYTLKANNWYHIKLDIEPNTNYTKYSLVITKDDEQVYPKSELSHTGVWTVKREPIEYYAVAFATYDCTTQDYAIDNLKVYEYNSTPILSAFNREADALKIFAIDNTTQKPLSSAITIKN